MKIGSRVKVEIGRNRGEVGTLKVISNIGDGQIAYIDFGRMITVYEGAGSTSTYPDGYWVPLNKLTIEQ